MEGESESEDCRLWITSFTCCCDCRFRIWPCRRYLFWSFFRIITLPFILLHIYIYILLLLFIFIIISIIHIYYYFYLLLFLSFIFIIISIYYYFYFYISIFKVSIKNSMFVIKNLLILDNFQCCKSKKIIGCF